MAFEGLSDKLSAAFKRLRSKGRLNEADVKEAMREVRLALLEADVNYKIAKEFTATVTEKCGKSHNCGLTYSHFFSHFCSRHKYGSVVISAYKCGKFSLSLAHCYKLLIHSA